MADEENIVTDSGEVAEEVAGVTDVTDEGAQPETEGPCCTEESGAGDSEPTEGPCCTEESGAGDSGSTE